VCHKSSANAPRHRASNRSEARLVAGLEALQYGSEVWSGMTGGRKLFPTRRRNVWCRALGSACLTSLVFATTVAVPLPSASAQAAPVGHLLDLINQDRAQQGVEPVALNAGLNAIAQGQANAMAGARRIYQNPAFPGNVPGANATGENVGYGPDIDSVHRAFVASPEHQVIIVGSAYRLVGLGVASSPIGLMVVENFVDTTGGGVVAPLPLPPVWKAPSPPKTVAAVHAAAAPAAPVPPAPAPPVSAPATAAAPPPSPPAPPPPPAPTFDMALYARMLQWDQWQTGTSAGD
jgi:hypothetical protein